MPRWAVTYRRGRSVKTIRVTAASSSAASAATASLGTVTHVARSATMFEWATRRVLAMSRGERAIFLVRMSGMLRNRITQLEAARTMTAAFGGSIKLASQRVVDHLAGGMNLIEAMEADPYNFPSSTVALMRATARQGDTADALKRVARFEDDMNRIGRSNRSFLVKAVVGLVFSFAIIAYSTYVWTPQVLDNPLLKERGYDFRWLVSLGEWSLVGMGTLLAAFIFVAFASTVGRILAPVTSDRIVDLVPIYRGVITARNIHISLLRLGILINSGMTYKEALETCIDDTPPGVMKRDLGRALTNIDGSVTDRPWSHEITALHMTDRASLAMARNKKDTSTTLMSLSTEYGEIYAKRLSMIGNAAAICGALFMFYGGLLIFYQTMLPMMEMLRDVSGS